MIVLQQTTEAAIAAATGTNAALVTFSSESFITTKAGAALVVMNLVNQLRDYGYIVNAIGGGEYNVPETGEYIRIF